MTPAMTRLAARLMMGLMVPCAVSSAQPSGVTFIVRVSPLSNLLYQLDCLAGIAQCSQAAYTALWHSKLGWSAEDQAQLGQWQRLREKYQGEIALNEPKAEPMALPWNGPTGLQLDQKFSIATFHAHDRVSLRSHWEVIVAPTDVPRLEAIVDHFEPRFTTWWTQNAEHDSEEFKHTLQHAIARTNLGNAIRSFARFYDVALPKDYPIYLNLFLRPKSGDTHTIGTQIENHAAVEFLSGENVNRRLGVVIHELCHFFYSSGSESRRRSLTSAFANVPDSLSLAGWGVLNEALATALGNGVAAERLDSIAFQRALKTERGFYNDAAIDAAAKAVMPWLKVQIGAGRTLYDSTFVAGYLSALKEGMPGLIQMPARLLTELTIIHDSEFRDVVEHDIRRDLRGGIYPYEGIDSDTSWTMLRTYPKLNALIVVSPKTLALLAKREEWVPQHDLEAMQRAFAGGSSWVYAIQRFPSTFVFIIGGVSGDDVLRGFHRLLNAKARFRGLLEE
jgi:hypothetical protein